MIKKAGLPEPVNELEIFQLDNPDMKMFETFHERLKAKIAQSPEWQRLQGKGGQVHHVETNFSDDVDSDIPF